MANTRTTANRKAAMRAAVKRFKHEHLFLHEPSSLGVTGLFEDKKNGEDRVILLYKKGTNTARLKREAARCFAGFQWKVVEQGGHVFGSAFNGTDAWHDGVGGHGTVGGWMKDKGGTTVYGLSNNHVIAAINNGQVGDPILQGPITIGTLLTWINLKPMPQPNKADIALFKLAVGQRPQWDPQRPAGSVGATQGMRVYKKGARSGLTNGIVTGVNGALNVELHGRMFHFEGLVAIQGDSGAFSEHGDSGSLVFSVNHFATAILFAKLDGDSYAYGFPIGAAAALFDGKEWA